MTMILSHHGTSKLMYHPIQVYITAILSGDLFLALSWVDNGQVIHFPTKNHCFGKKMDHMTFVNQ